MTDYPFDMQLVVDPQDENKVIRDGLVSIYDSEDEAGVELLALKSPAGVPLPNPLTANAYGFIRRFVTTSPKVKGKSGDFEVFFFSFDGVLNEAVSAREAAQSAQLAAETAGLTAAAAAEEQLAQAVADAETSANIALAAQTEIATARQAAEDAAAAAEGGGFAEHPGDPYAFIITTKADGSVIVDPTDPDAFVITF